MCSENILSQDTPSIILLIVSFEDKNLLILQVWFINFLITHAFCILRNCFLTQSHKDILLYFPTEIL